MADAVHQFGNISLGSSGGLSQGQLKITPAGLAWKKASGGRVVEIKKEEISSLCWTKVSRGCQFGVSRIGASTINFLGFRDKDLEGIAPFCQKSYGLEIKDQSMSTSGRNWGNLAIDGGSLTFIVDGRVAFQLPLPDVSQAQQVKDDLVLELLADDTALDDRADALAEVAFHVPTSNTSFPTRENGDVPAKVLLDAVLEQTDAGAATASEVVCTFSEVGVVTPRGRFEVEMHLGFLSLTGQTQDFKIRYTSIMRIFILPKSNSPHTLVVISLDPPIRKGQTHYNHLLCQFPTDTEEEVNLEISDEALAAKNEKIGGKLTRNVRGPTFEVFAKVLRGLSSARITKPGAFKDVAGDGSCVRCSYKADDGHLYPLDRAFFYVPKPPLMVPFEDIESVEFARQGGGVISSSVRTFDLVVRMRNDTEHQFRNIQRTEWQNLFEFIKSRKIRIENLASAQQGPGGPGKAVDLGDDVDPGMRRAEAEADSEDDDEDFQAGEDSGSSDGELDSANGSGSGSDDVEMVDEEGITVADVADNKKKRKGKEGGAAAEGANKDGGGGWLLRLRPNSVLLNERDKVLLSWPQGPLPDSSWGSRRLAAGDERSDGCSSAVDGGLSDSRQCPASANSSGSVSSSAWVVVPSQDRLPCVDGVVRWRRRPDSNEDDDWRDSGKQHDPCTTIVGTCWSDPPPMPPYRCPAAATAPDDIDTADVRGGHTRHPWEKRDGWDKWDAHGTPVAAAARLLGVPPAGWWDVDKAAVAVWLVSLTVS